MAPLSDNNNPRLISRLIVFVGLLYLCCHAGNFGWVGNEFTYNGGAGLVISQEEEAEDSNVNVNVNANANANASVNVTAVQQMRAVFDRDWHSRYAKPLQLNKMPVCAQQQQHEALTHSLKSWDDYSVEKTDGPNASL